MRWARYRPTVNSNAGSNVTPPSISYAGSPFTWYDYYTSVSLSVTNTGGDATYAVSAGALPTGVSLNAGTGAITGTPTALKTAANVTITATNAGGTSDAVLNIAVIWFPLSISGLKAGYDTASGFSSLWQDAGRTTAAGDTDPCGAMDDLSGQGNHVTQATAGARPTVAATGLNSLRALTFDGGDFLTLAALAGGAEAQANTALIVLKLGAASGCHFISGSALGTRNVIYVAGSGNWAIYAGSVLDSGDASNTSVHLHTATFNGASSKQYLDNTEIGSGNAGAFTMVGMHLGVDYTGAGQILPSGSILATALFYNTDIGATARGNLKTWAVNKWGTPA